MAREWTRFLSKKDQNWSIFMVFGSTFGSIFWPLGSSKIDVSSHFEMWRHRTVTLMRSSVWKYLRPSVPHFLRSAVLRCSPLLRPLCLISRPLTGCGGLRGAVSINFVVRFWRFKKKINVLSRQHAISQGSMGFKSYWKTIPKTINNVWISASGLCIFWHGFCAMLDGFWVLLICSLWGLFCFEHD